MDHSLRDGSVTALPMVIILDDQHRINTKFVGYPIRETPNKIIAVLDRLIRADFVFGVAQQIVGRGRRERVSPQT
jgi:hypothetical protein